MALKALILRKKIEEANKKLATLRDADVTFETRKAELVQAIEEAETDEDTAAVEEMADAFEAEEKEHSSAKDSLENEIRELEAELEAEEKEQNTDPAPKQEERKAEEMTTVETRGRIEELVTRDNVKSYLDEVRASIKEKRAISNAGLTVPTEVLGILRENVTRYSKLYDRVNVRRIGGDGRMVVMGAVPEAIWTECCANLNELDLVFNDVEVDCYKVGGYYAVCNATLEDSDVDLANEIIAALGQAIGLALDKAILFGTGTKMPLGVVSRLAQTAEPTGYPATARAWANLSTTNIKSIAADVTGVDLFAAIAGNMAAMKGAYSRGVKTHAMNEATYSKIVAAAMTVDAGGAIVSGVNGTMPVIGGDIVVLNFIPDDVIISGYFELYLLAERAGQKFATSEHVRFLQDQTVSKGTARYDGQPVIPEAFVAIGINGVTPTAAMTFAPDTANAEADPEG